MKVNINDYIQIDIYHLYKCIKVIMCFYAFGYVKRALMHVFEMALNQWCCDDKGIS